MPAKKKQMGAAQASKLAGALIEAKDTAKRCYQQAGELTDQLVAGGLVGVGIPLPGGRTLRIVDQFAGGKTKIFKSTAFARYAEEVTEE
jgi:F0F1-type ATP synthase assembly protein I